MPVDLKQNKKKKTELKHNPNYGQKLIDRSIAFSVIRQNPMLLARFANSATREAYLARVEPGMQRKSPDQLENRMKLPSAHFIGWPAGAFHYWRKEFDSLVHRAVRS